MFLKITVQGWVKGFMFGTNLIHIASQEFQCASIYSNKFLHKLLFAYFTTY